MMMKQPRGKLPFHQLAVMLVARVPKYQQITVIVDSWIKVMNEFNDGEKLRSKKKGRFFQSEWLKNTNGFHIAVTEASSIL
jgi:hypothetical protein